MATSAGELTFTIAVDASQLLTAQRTVTVSVNNMSSNINTLTTSTNNASSGFNRLTSSVAASASPLNRVSSLVTGISAALATDRIISYADAWTTVGNKITNYMKTGQNLIDVQESLYKVAQDTRTPLQAVATLYGRLEPATRNIISSGSELLKITDTINKAFVVSGATGEESAASIIQLAQALGAGALRGEEFNSVNEQAPRIMQGIAESMGVARGELKTLAAQGKLTTDVVIKAIQDMSGAVDSEFSKMNATFGQKGTVALNNLTKSFGESNGVQSAVGLLGDALIGLSNNIGVIGNTAGALATLMLARFVGSMYASAAASLSAAAANKELAAASVVEAESSLYSATATLNRANAEKYSTITTLGLIEAKLSAAKAIGVENSAEVQLALSNEHSIRIQLEQIASEKALEVQRLKSQISTTGLIQTSTRMAEVRRAEVVLNQRLAAAELETSAARNIATQKEIAISSELAAAKAQLRNASLSVVAATEAEAAAKASLSSATASASVANSRLTTVMSVLGGPAGIITIAAIGVYALVSAMRSGSETAIDYSGNIDTVTSSLKKMNKEQASAEGVKLQQKITEQRQALAEATQQAVINEQRLNYLRKSGADTSAQEDKVTLAKGKQADEQQKLNDLLAGQEAVNKRVNAQEEKNTKIQNEKKGVSAKAQKIIDDLNARTEAEKAYGTAQSARILAEKDAKDAGVTDPKEIKLIQDKAAALWEQTNSRKAATKESKAAASEAKKDAAAQQQNADKISDSALKVKQLQQELTNLKNGTEEGSEATSRYTIESARLEAQQQLNADATQKEIDAQAQQILTVHQLTEKIAALKKKQAEDTKTAQSFETVEKKTGTKGQNVEDQYKEDLKALENYHKMAGASNSRYEKTKSRLEEKYRKDKQAAAIEDYKAQSEWNTFLMDGLDALGQSATTTIAGLASGTMTATEAMQNFANIILNQAVGALVEMGLNQIKNTMLSNAMAQTQQANIVATNATGIAAGSANAAAQAGNAATVAAAAAPAAAATATFSWGTAAVVGGAALLATYAIAKSAGGRQFGGGVNAGGMYRVGENGRAEVLTQGGRNYLLPGDSGGQVTPLNGMGGGGFSQQVNITNSAGANVSTNSSADGKQLNIMIDQRVSQSIRKKQGMIARAFRGSTNTSWRAQ